MSTISTSGIAANSIIRAEHILRVINALSNVANNDILITGSLTVTGSTALSGSLNVTGGITGSVFGTSSNATSASYAVNARNATSASYALTASYAISASYEINYETSSSYANDATSASYATVAQTLLGSVVSASYALSSSNAASATSASYSTVAQTLLGSVVSASYALSSSYSLSSTNAANATLANFATNAGYAATAGDADTLDGLQATSFVRNSQTSSMTVNSASFAINASSSLYALTASFAMNGGGGTTINTGSFATTGSNTFSGSQTITGSVSISGSQNITGSLSVDSGTIINSDAFSIMRIYPNIINIENQGSPFDYTLLSLGVLSYNSASNAQQLLFPASLSTGIKAITLPNDNGTVALTYNTATTGSNIFSGSQTITGSLNVSGSSTFRGNQIVNANLTLTSSATMSILTTGGNSGVQITKDQILINPNLNSDRVTLSGGNLQLSAANSYSGLYLTNRNASNDTGSIEIHRTEFYGKSTDANFGIKAGLKVYQAVGTGSLGSFNFYTSASQGFGFTTGDLDMRISSGSKIELFRNTTITGSLNVKGDVNISGSKQFGIEADTSKTFIKSTGVFINESETRAKATLSPGVLDVTGRPGAAEVVLRNNNDLDDTTFDAGQISFYGPSDSNAYGGVQGKIQARVDSGSGVVASYLEFYTAGNGGFPFDSSDVDMRISSGSRITLFRNTTITGSVSITSVLTLAPNNPLPSAQPTGSIAVSGSGADCKPYFWNGTTWTSLI
jgi:cytoskeletal protein CcmA (bactofilin family)